MSVGSMLKLSLYPTRPAALQAISRLFVMGV